MKTPLVTAIVAVLFAASTSDGAVIYSEDFSSAPVWNSTVDNANTNRAGTGAATDLNQNEWYTRGTRSTITHDSVNENLDINRFNNNIYFLMDLTNLENDPGSITDFTISFDVLNYSVAGGAVDFFAFAGGGLDYSGTGNGHIFFRTYNNPPLFSPSSGATATQIVDGTTTSITGTGTFTTNAFTLLALDDPGDYLFIGFVGTSNNSDTITIDNLQLTAVGAPVPEPSSFRTAPRWFGRLGCSAPSVPGVSKGQRQLIALNHDRIAKDNLPGVEDEKS